MTLFLSTLLMASMAQAAPPGQNVLSAACPEVEYFNLSQSAPLEGREICVSPGILTGIIFDLPVEVDVQEELRFMSLLQGQREIALRPPQDMAPGEKLRLTAKLGKGTTRQEVTFLLVARTGQATHQVEVYHDTRSRESILQEATEEHVKNQKLQEENQRLLTELERVRTELHRFSGLTGAYLSDALTSFGITALGLTSDRPPVPVFATEVRSYRSFKSVAIQATINNTSTEDWTAIGVSLFDTQGRPLEGMVLTHASTIAPQKKGEVFLEATTASDAFHGTYTLNLLENGPRTATLSGVIFPQ